MMGQQGAAAGVLRLEVDRGSRFDGWCVGCARLQFGSGMREVAVWCLENAVLR
jgi:hypothetical protein